MHMNQTSERSAITDGAQPQPPPIVDLRALLEILAAIIAPSSIIIALLYYYGWLRTVALMGVFGIDAHILAFSPEDYLLRSADGAFRSAAMMAVTLLGVAIVIHLLRRHIGRDEAPNGVSITIGMLSLVGFLYGIGVMLGIVSSNRPGAAATLLIVSIEVSWLYFPRFSESARGRASTTRIARAALAAILALGLFWSVSISAQDAGRRIGHYWLSNPAARPSVTVYSDLDLGLTGEGVDMARSNSETHPFRYTGFHLLVYSNSRWVLFSGDGVTPHGNTVILQDLETIRVEVAAPNGTQ